MSTHSIMFSWRNKKNVNNFLVEKKVFCLDLYRQINTFIFSP